MANKLPVKTIPLHSNKKWGVILSLFISVILIILLSRFYVSLDGMPGKVLTIILLIGTAVLLFFNTIALLVLARTKFIGFFISSEGMNDESTGNNYGLVYWKDVLKIRIVDDLEHFKRKYIVLKVQNPQEYINREPSLIKKRTMVLKYQHYGSPICFSERGLNCTFKELE
ncbi:MAG: hypothetical protein LBH77_02920, partial [Tannerella sp.]|nr:hypothetical protein [Tannerella sp.]